MTRLAVLALLLIIPDIAAAQGARDIYSDEELTSDRPRYERVIHQIFQLGLWNYMNADEQAALSGVTIEMPTRGSSPLEALSHSLNGAPTVVLPILSLKFIEDLCLSYAWRSLNGYSLEPIDEYVAMLKYRPPENFPGARMPAPLQALGVPPDVWRQDTRVGDLALRFRNSAWAFIVAHELGHLRFGHPGNLDTDAATSQENESEADAFAVRLLSRSDTIPMGMVLWFQASIGYFRNRADFQTEEDYWEWVRSGATHPVNPRRLQRLGVLLNEAASATLSAKNAEVMRFIALKLGQIAAILAEPDQQRLVARCAVLGDPADLRRLRDRPCDERMR
jgi:hypothetical protein